MRLAEFIQANVEPILVEWETFARSIWPEAATLADPAEVRDDAEAILLATAADMQSEQTDLQQAQKSRGSGRAGEDRSQLALPSASHGSGRVASGFDLWAVIAEYRALRASVLRLWRDSEPAPDLRDLDDLTRFNESIDQSLTLAVRSYAEQVERNRQALLGQEQSARKDAEEASRAKDIFLATLSHELRTPLNAIVGWLSILRHKGIDPAQVEEGLNVIDRNTRAQVQLIDDVLDVSRIVSGKLRVQVYPCELAEVINAGVDVMRPAAEARGITLTVRLDPAASSASCDGTRIQQVVWNLVSNAVKFTPKGGHVDVFLSREQSSTRIEVRDDGSGISADVLPHIFDRFRQADSSTRRGFGGLGLGLSIVKYIVEAHGGTVQAHSDGDGLGSTFIISLPIRAVHIDEEPLEDGDMTLRAGESAPEAPGELLANRPPIRLDGLRVLVVDDEADARRVLVLVLEEAGATVIASGSVDEALASLREAQPDVLVSDLGMPGRDGFDLIRHVRERHDAETLPAVALTAFVQKDDAQFALVAGFQVHVSKPVDPHHLTSVIATLVSRPN